MPRTRKRTILQLMFLLLLTSFIAACASTTPLPANITFFEPSPRISPKLAAFLGIWEGRWAQSQDVIIVVERIGNDYAEVIFSVGLLNAAGIIPEDIFYYVRADVISDSAIGWNTANGNRFIFEMRDGFNKIRGHFIESSTGAEITTDMKRANAAEFPGLKIHRYPYIEYIHPLKGKMEFVRDNNFCLRKAAKQSILLAYDVRRYKMWEEVDRCLRDDFGWTPLEKGFRPDRPALDSEVE